MDPSHSHHHHESVGTYLQQGKDHLEAGEYEAAYREFSLAVHLVEDHDASSDISDEMLGELYLLRASAQMSGQQELVFQDQTIFHQVLEDLDQAIDAQPYQPAYRLTRGRLYKQAGFTNYLEQAKADFEAVLAVNEEAVEAMRELGEVLTRMEKFDEALPLLSKAIRLQPDKDSYMMRGVAFFKKTPADYAAAALDFQEAQKRAPEEEALYLWRAQCFQEMGLLQDALNEYDRLLAMVDTNAGYFVDRGFLLDQADDPDGALRDYNRALDLAEHPLAYNNRAMHYLLAGDTGAAIADAEAAIRLDPELGIAYATLAEIYATLDDREQMLHYLGHAMDKYYQDSVEVMLEPAFERYLTDDDFQRVIAGA